MAFPTITAGGSQSWSSQSSVTFSSITGLAVDKLLLIAVYSQVVSGTPNKPTVTGTGFTFTEVTSQINGIGRLTIFRALNKGSSATSVNPTIDFAGQSQDVTKFSSVIVTGAHLGGENGELAVRQVASAASASAATTGTVTIPNAFRNFDGMTIGIIAIRNSSAATAGSGFAISTQTSSPIPGTRLFIQSKNGEDRTVDATWSNAIWQGVALEIRSARSEPVVPGLLTNYHPSPAVYGAALGYGAANSHVGNRTRLMAFTPMNDGEPTSITMAYSLVAAGSITMSPIIYKDDGTGTAPGKLIAYGGATTYTSTTKSTVNMSLTTPSTRFIKAGQKYWYGVRILDPGNVGVNLYRYYIGGTKADAYDFTEAPGGAIENPRTTVGALNDGAEYSGYLSYRAPGLHTNSTYGHRRIKAVLDPAKISGTYTTTAANAEVLVKVTDPQLKSSDNGGFIYDVQAMSLVSARSYDFLTQIRFVRGDTGASMPHDLLYWDRVNGTVWAYVKMPSTVPATFGDVYLCFGEELGYNSSGHSTTSVFPTGASGWRFVHLFKNAPDASAGDELVDETSNALNLNSVNMTAANWVDGKHYKAIDFNGTNQSLTMVSSSLSDFNQNTTIAVWIKFDTITKAYQDIYSKSHGALRLDYGAMGAGIRSLNLVKYGIIDQHVNVTSAITSTGVWYHIAAVQSATAVTYYVNGVSVGSYANSSAFTAIAASSATIGGTSNWLDAQIASIKFTNERQLTADQIKTMYDIENAADLGFRKVDSPESAFDRYYIGGDHLSGASGHKFAFSSGGDPGNATGNSPSWLTKTYFDQYSFFQTGQSYVNTYFETLDLTISGLRYSPTLSIYMTPYGNVTVDSSPGSMLGSDLNAVPVKDIGVSIAKTIKSAWLGGIAFVSYGSNDPGHRVDLNANLTTRDFFELSNMITYYNNGRTVTSAYFDMSGSVGVKLNTAGDKWVLTKTVGSSYSPEINFGSTNWSVRDFSQLEVDFNAPGIYGWLEFAGRPIKKLTVREDSQVNWWYYEGEGADQLILEAGVIFEGEAYSPANTAKLYVLDVLTIAGTALKPVTLRWYANDPAQEIANIQYDATAAVTVDYMHNYNMYITGGTYNPGANSLLYRSNMGWVGGSLVASPGTIDNTETITGTGDMLFMTAPGTIASTAVVTDVFNVSNYNQYVIPDPMPGAQFGDLFISNYLRTIEVGTVPTATVITSPTNVYNETQYIIAETIIDNTNVEQPAAIGELAPNDTSPSYDYYARTVRSLRDISASILISFTKAYDPGAGLFVIGTSQFDGGDVWRGNGSAIQEWDKFEYGEYADKLLGFEYHYEQDVLGGMVLGMADIRVKNYDGYFSPYGDSPIASNILPGRPLRLYAGYQQALEQVFVGQTMRLPETTKDSAKFHAKDFIGSFAENEITDGRIYTNVTTDQVLDDILSTDAGLSPTQYDLDLGENTINFLEIKRGTKIGSVIRDLMQAEGGRTYQDYDGTIYFKNRTNKTRPTAITLREGYVYSEVEPDESNVINRVKIEADVRAIQTSRQVYPALKDGSLTQYEDFQAFKVAAGETVEKFFSFKNPVTSFTHPTVGGGITANTLQDGTGANRNADLSRSIAGVFTDSVKYTFTNTSGTDLYVTACTISGTPATIVEEIRIDVSDATSITKYGEQLLEIKNHMYTDKDFAQDMADAIVLENKDAPSVRELTVKGLPYMAVGDVIEHYDGNDYVVDVIDGRHSPSNGHSQTIRIRKVA